MRATWQLALLGLVLTNPASARAQSASAVAKGPCAVAINASGSSIVTVRQVCNYGSLSPAQQKVIDRLVDQARQTARKTSALAVSDANQTALLQSLSTSDANQNSLLQALSAGDAAQDAVLTAVSLNGEAQSQQIAALRDEIAAIYQLFNERAAAADASGAIKTASAELAKGKVEPAVKLLGEEAAAAATGAASNEAKAEAAALFVQQAALLQTQNIAEARAALERAIAVDPDNLTTLANAAVLAGLAGDAKRALELQGQIVANTQARVSKKPDDALAQRDLAIALGSLGFVQFNIGNYPAARASYGQSLTLMEALCKRDPTNQEWRRLLGSAYANISDVQVIEGKAALALESAEKSRTIAQDFANQFPGDATRYDLVGRHVRIGDLQMSLGRSSDAAKSYQDALGLLEPIIKANPTVESGYSDLVLIHAKTGQLLHATGDLSGAIKNYEKARSVAKARFKKDPANIYWKRTLAMVEGGLGDAQFSRPMLTQSDMGKFTDDALESFDRAYALTKEISEIDPGNRAWQSDMWFALSRLGKVRALRGENLVALDHYAMSLGIIEALANASPDVAIFQRQLGMNHWWIGSVQLAQNKRADASMSFGKALGRAEKASEMEPTVIEYKRDIALYAAFAGQVLAMEGDAAASVASFKRAVDLRRQISIGDANNGQWRLDLALVQSMMGTMPGLSNDERRAALEAALAGYQEHEAKGNSPPMPPGAIAFLEARLNDLNSDAQ